MGYEVLLTDDSVELVPDADSYAPEGPLTTFFAVDGGRQPRLNAWSRKLGSIRTDRIVRIRAIEGETDGGGMRHAPVLRSVAVG